MSVTLLKRVVPGLCALVGVAVLASQGRADSVTLSSAVGTWSDPVGPGVATVNYQTVGAENQIRWGSPASLSGQSALGFEGVAPPPQTFDTGTQFDVGTLTHYNNPIASTSQLLSAKLTLMLTFSDPSGLSGTFPFTFTIDETPNAPGGPSDNDNIIIGGNGIANETVLIDGTLYTLQLLGFRDGAGQPVLSLSSPENGETDATLVGMLTTPAGANVVPLPPAALAGLWLLGGMSATRVIRHRWSRHAH